MCRFFSARAVSPYALAAVAVTRARGDEFFSDGVWTRTITAVTVVRNDVRFAGWALSRGGRQPRCDAESALVAGRVFFLEINLYFFT